MMKQKDFPELFADERCSQTVLDFLATDGWLAHQWQRGKRSEQRGLRVGEYLESARSNSYRWRKKARLGGEE